MDQQTANRIAYVNAVTIAVLGIGGTLALVLLAAFRDGVYTQLLASALPDVIYGTLAVLGVGVGAHAIGSALQTKYVQQTQTAQAQAQAAVIQAQNTQPAPAPAPAAPAVLSVPTPAVTVAISPSVAAATPSAEPQASA